jgi:hypothetical protein
MSNARIPIWNQPVNAWCLPRVRLTWVWVCCGPLCGHRRAIPLAPFRIRWDDADIYAAIRRRFRCGGCGRSGCTFMEPRIDAEGIEPFPVGHVLRIGGDRKIGETVPNKDARVRAEYTRCSCPPPVRALGNELGQGGAGHFKEDLDVHLPAVWTPAAAGQPGEGKGAVRGAEQCFHAQRCREMAGGDSDDAPVIAPGRTSCGRPSQPPRRPQASQYGGVAGGKPAEIGFFAYRTLTGTTKCPAA